MGQGALLYKLPPFYQADEEQKMRGRNWEWQRSNFHVLRSENVGWMLPKQLLEWHSPLFSLKLKHSLDIIDFVGRLTS